MIFHVTIQSLSTVHRNTGTFRWSLVLIGRANIYFVMNRSIFLGGIIKNKFKPRAPCLPTLKRSSSKFWAYSALSFADWWAKPSGKCSTCYSSSDGCKALDPIDSHSKDISWWNTKSINFSHQSLWSNWQHFLLLISVPVVLLNNNLTDTCLQVYTQSNVQSAFKYPLQLQLPTWFCWRVSSHLSHKKVGEISALDWHDALNN